MNYFIVSALSEQFLVIKPKEELTVKKIGIHVEHIHDKTSYNIAVCLENSTPYRIKKMLESRIPFMEIDKQMYLPFMALHLRKSMKAKKEVVKRKKFTPSTQMVFLAILYWQKTMFDASDIAKQLNLSEIAISRSTTELESLGLLRSKIRGKTGRKKIFTPIEKKEFCSMGKEYLDSQITKTVFVKELPTSDILYKSGLTALSEKTMLGEPAQAVYAIYSKKADILTDVLVSREQALEESLPKVQLVKYDIGLLTSDNFVDPITLILGLEETDDRVEIAVEQLMEDVVWYEG